MSFPRITILFSRVNTAWPCIFFICTGCHQQGSVANKQKFEIILAKTAIFKCFLCRGYINFFLLRKLTKHVLSLTWTFAYGCLSIHSTYSSLSPPIHTKVIRSVSALMASYVNVKKKGRFFIFLALQPFLESTLLGFFRNSHQYLNDMNKKATHSRIHDFTSF